MSTTVVKMISSTAYPVETVYLQWLQSRTQDSIPSAKELNYNLKNGTLYPDEVSVEARQEKINKVFDDVITMKMPLTETITFTFLLENVPVALREQMVRHRIAHRFGDQIGADIVPDLAGSSSFWSQTMRILDMSNFASEGKYYTPEAIDSNDQAATLYAQTMETIEVAYQSLMKLGIPIEDARNVLPVALTHRLTWTTNLAALLHVLSKRTCWHSQLGMWEPVIRGMIKELADKVHPSFNKLLDPPCIGKDGNFAECAFKAENIGLMSTPEKPDGGNNPPCSLWIWHHCPIERSSVETKPPENGVAIVTEPMEKDAVGEKNWSRYGQWKDKFAELWVRHPLTGERKKVS